MNRFLALLVGVTLSLTLAAACGGDDDQTIETDDGEVSFSDELPDDFPDDFPVYPDAELEGSATGESEGVRGWTVTWQSEDDIDDIVAFYDDEFGGDGPWRQVSRSEVNEATIYAVQNEDENVGGSLSVGQENGNVAITAFVGEGNFGDDDDGSDDEGSGDDGSDGEDDDGGGDDGDDGDDAGGSLPPEQDLPDDFPVDEVPLPDDIRVTSATTLTTQGVNSYQVEFYSQASAEELQSHFEEAMPGAGWTEAFSSTSNGETILTYTRPDGDVGVSVNVLIGESDVEGYRTVSIIASLQ